MILGIEIALAVYGVLGLISGTLIVSKSKVVQGQRARLLGSLALVPIVAAFVLIFTMFGNPRTMTLIEGIIAGVVAVAVFTTGYLMGVNPDAANQNVDFDEDQVEYDETPIDPDLDDVDPDDLMLTDAAPPPSTGPVSENLDYFDKIAEHLDYFEMNPEHLDYLGRGPSRAEPPGGRPDLRDDLGSEPTRPEPGPPRPGTHPSSI
jgi:hypothetical protein